MFTLCFLIIIIIIIIKLKTIRFFKLNKYEHIRNMVYSKKYIILTIYIDSYQQLLFFFHFYLLMDWIWISELFDVNCIHFLFNASTWWTIWFMHVYLLTIYKLSCLSYLLVYRIHHVLSYLMLRFRQNIGMDIY